MVRQVQLSFVAFGALLDRQITKIVGSIVTMFISIKVKKLTSNGNACITNQYLPVSNNQMTIDVTKIIKRHSGACI